MKKAAEKYKNKVWYWLCDTVYTGKTFKISDTAKQCPFFESLSLTTKRQYFTAILESILDEYENNPESCPIEKISSQVYLMREDVEY